MPTLDNIFGIHEHALRLHAQRASVLASNLSNADTPNYKARDLDFAAVLRGEGDKMALGLVQTSARHLAVGGSATGADLKYRNPHQPSLDGNTVEVPIEQAAFAQTAVRYQASLMFINRRVASIETAITGN